MTGNVVVQQPASWVITLTVTQQERDDLTALFYRFKDGQVTTGLPADVGARVNNLALPLYQLFDDGVTPPAP
jgi:hypothetical protein